MSDKLLHFVMETMRFVAWKNFVEYSTLRNISKYFMGKFWVLIQNAIYLVYLAHPHNIGMQHIYLICNLLFVAYFVQIYRATYNQCFVRRELI